MALTKDITCLDAVALVSDFLEGALGRRERRRLERHPSNCDACSAYLEQMRATITLGFSGIRRPRTRDVGGNRRALRARPQPRRLTQRAGSQGVEDEQ